MDIGRVYISDKLYSNKTISIVIGGDEAAAEIGKDDAIAIATKLLSLYGVNITIEHELSMDCYCEPELIDGVVVHNLSN